MSHELTEGTKLEFVAVNGEAGDVYRADSDRIADIEVSMEPGQMALVPWAKVTFTDGTVSLVNLALAQAVDLANPSSQN